MSAKFTLITVLRNIFPVLRKSYRTFTVSDPLRMAAATAFFTTFALPPILIIIIQALGLFFKGNINRKVFSRLADTIGRSSTEQVVDTLRAFKHLAGDWYLTLGVVVLLAFVATNLFKIIQDSVNEIWNLRYEAKQRTFLRKMKTRWHGLFLILLTAFLFSLAILLEGTQSYLGDRLQQLVPAVASYLSGFFNQLIVVVLVSAWFSLLFRVLPDGQPSWPVVAAGGLFTGILFSIGKLVLRVLLIQSNVNSLFGASAAFVLLLLFVFYTSLILYFGAAFTLVIGEAIGQPIRLRQREPSSASNA